MFQNGQRLVENFFKRTRFRRSRRLRNSFRSSIIGQPNVADGESPMDGQGTTASVAIARAESDVGEKQPFDRQPSARKSQRWRQSFARMSRRSRPQDGVKFGDQEAKTQMPIVQSSASKTRPRTADARRLESDAMETKNPVELLSYKFDDKEKANTDSKMVELLKNEVTNLRTETIKQKETITGLQEREKTLQNRLSEQARRQLDKGTKFEDLNLGTNRPTQLVERYGNLYSEGRVDALDALDELPEIGECEDLKAKLLLSIIVLSFRSAQKSLLDLRARVRELLHIPRVLQSGQPPLCHAARDFEDEMGLYLRKTVEKHDLSKNYNEVSERVWSTLFDYPSLRECKGLKKYIAECVSTSWALTVQNPPLIIDYELGSFSEERHTRFHTSDSESKVVKSFLWPSLAEGGKGDCVSKGIVIT